MLLEVKFAALTVKQIDSVAAIRFAVPRSACPLENEAKANPDPIKKPGARFSVATLDESFLFMW